MLKRKIFLTLFPLAAFLCSTLFFAACATTDTELGDGQVGGTTNSPSTEVPDAPTEDDEQPAPTPPPAHVHTAEYTAAKEATCTKEGNVEYWFCDECGKYFSDADFSNEINPDFISIEATGHSPVTDAAVEADCSHTGLTEGSHCANCSEVLTPQTVTERKEHGFVGGKCAVCEEWQVSSGLDFEATDGGYAVTGLGSCTAEYILIPETNEGEPVVKISEFAFSGSDDIKGVKIPVTVKEIGLCAFENCPNLEEVYTGDGVSKIELSAFAGCVKLKTVQLSSNLTTLETQVFGGCTGLEELDIPAGVEKICSYAFLDCENLKRITIHAGIKEIESNAFDGCAAFTELIFVGTEEEWSEVVNSADGTYKVKFEKV